jgi:hypothetical protein
MTRSVLFCWGCDRASIVSPSEVEESVHGQRAVGKDRCLDKLGMTEKAWQQRGSAERKRMGEESKKAKPVPLRGTGFALGLTAA